MTAPAYPDPAADPAPRPFRLRLPPDGLPALRLAAGLVVGVLIVLGAARLVGYPVYTGHDAVLLTQPSAPARTLGVVVSMLAATAAATLVAGRVRYDIGVVAACLGWWAASTWGGGISPTLSGQTRGIYGVLFFETVLLGGVVLGVWGLLHLLRERGSLRPGLRRFLELPDAELRQADRKAAGEPLDQRLLATAIAAGTVGFFVVILAHDEARVQAWAAVGVGTFFGVGIAHGFIATRPAGWFVAAPVLVAAVGYAAAWWSAPDALTFTGRVGGFLAPLARPLPADWVGLGVPLAWWAYLRSRRKQSHRVQRKS